MPNFIAGATRVYAPPARPKVVVRMDARATALAPDTPAQTNRNDSYLTALLKLIPTEVVSIFMAFRDTAHAHGFSGLLFFVCIGLCLVIRSIASGPKTGLRHLRDVQWLSVVIACVGFVLWVFSIGGEPPFPKLSIDQSLASFLAAVLSVVAPLIVPADASAPGA